jgi:hypothetical protein
VLEMMTNMLRWVSLLVVFLKVSLTQLTLNAEDLQNIFADDFSLSRPLCGRGCRNG